MDVPGFFSYYDNMGISCMELLLPILRQFLCIYIYVCNLTYMSVCPIVNITETSNCQFSTQYVPWIGTQIFSLSGLQRDGNASIQFGVHQLTPCRYNIYIVYTPIGWYRIAMKQHFWADWAMIQKPCFFCAMNFDNSCVDVKTRAGHQDVHIVYTANQSNFIQFHCCEFFLAAPLGSFKIPVVLWRSFGGSYILYILGTIIIHE
jgi:hypothetical protein